MNLRISCVLPILASLVLLGVLGSCGTTSPKRKMAKLGSNDGWMRIDSHPRGVTLYTNGRMRYESDGTPLRTPCLVQMESGIYEFKLEMTGYRAWLDTVVIAPRETTDVLVQLSQLWTERQYQIQESVANCVGITLAVLLGYLWFTLK